jgi:glycosyltransferase involved in cell wall biosynthesis
MGDEINVDKNQGRALRCSIGAPHDSILAVYSGNVGVAAGLRTVLEAYALLRGDPRIRLLIAGEGADLEASRRFAGRESLPTVAFHAPYPQTDEPAVLGAADVFILPTQGAQSSVSVPSKLLAYMNAGRPILASALEDSDVASIIADSGAGWVVGPDDAAAVAAKLREISSMPEGDLAIMGELGRRYVREVFDRERALGKVTSIVLSQVSRREMSSNSDAA